jgi:CheY-specific phosphatase CheX
MSVSIPVEQIHKYLTHSLNKVFTTMAHANCELLGQEAYTGGQALSPAIDPEKDPSTHILASCVGFAGDVSGVCYLFMGNRFASHIAKQVTGLDDEDLDDETVRDVCGEMTNMAAGTFKNCLADLGLPSTLTVPTVMQGKRMAINTAGTADQFRFSFEVDGFPVFADLLLSDH